MVGVRWLGHSTRLYRLSRDLSTTEVERLLERLRSRSDVEYAEPNHTRRPFASPNDTWYPYQWNLRAMNLDRAWQRTTGNPGVVVAVVDTGVLPNHPDLKGRLLPGYDFVSSSTSSGDGDGWDADPTDNGVSNDLNSSRFHGTFVAGIIGAASNNKLGIAGVTWNCRILPVRAMGIDRGVGTDADIIAAVRWAAGLSVQGAPANPNPAKVINLSMGDPHYGHSLAEAVREVQQLGVVVVAAAGNSGNDKTNYPAGYDDVIAVGATQRNGTRASYSSYGAVVDIMAPGGDISQQMPDMPACSDKKPCPAGIVSTFYASSTSKHVYKFFDGTSLAAPQVSGVVALMLSVNPNLNGGETLRVLHGTANPSGRCPEGCGAGLVDAAFALDVVAGAASIDDTRWPQSNMHGGAVYGGCHLSPAATEGDLALPLILLAALLVFRRQSLRSGARRP